jgi:hypothetical protein
MPWIFTMRMSSLGAYAVPDALNVVISAVTPSFPRYGRSPHGRRRGPLLVASPAVSSMIWSKRRRVEFRLIGDTLAPVDG